LSRYIKDVSHISERRDFSLYISPKVSSSKDATGIFGKMGSTHRRFGSYLFWFGTNYFCRIVVFSAKEIVA